MRWSIRYQLLVPLLLLLVGLVGMTTWAAWAAAARARHQIETQVRHIVETVNHSTFPLTARVLHLMKGFSGADYLVVEPSGERLTTLDTSEIRLPSPATVSEGLPDLTLDAGVTVGGRAYLSGGARLDKGTNAGSTLYVLYPESVWQDEVRAAVLPPLVLGAVVGLAALTLAVVVARGLSRPIRELERRTRLIAAGDFSPMPLPHRNDELRDLTRSVNDMAERLAHYQETVQRSERLRLLGQVSGGLAHQLRNAVTGARLAVQLHARECQGPAEAEEISVALRQLALVEMHLKRFLDLGGADELRREPCSLQAVLDETVALLGPQCRHAHIDLCWSPAARPMNGKTPWTVLGDSGQLAHLFLNLATNAMEAAGPGGRVELDLRAEADGKVVVEVTDSGAGPAPELARRLFEPFVTGKREGVGLGLAVARQVAEAHGGQISWRRDAGRTCFTVELPLEKAQ